MHGVSKAFFVEEIVLADVNIANDSISITYLIDGEPNVVTLKYHDVTFGAEVFKEKSSQTKFAVSLGVFGVARFAAVLPHRIDFSKYREWIHPKLIQFLKYVLQGKWSEHRYQVGRMSYLHPEFILGENDDKSIGNNIWPIWKLQEDSHKVLLASGSGKDSVLCALMLEKAGIPYDIVTYLHDHYGPVEKQDRIFSGVTQRLGFGRQFKITVHDAYFPWLEERIAVFKIQQQIDKYFRREAGEVFFLSLALIPIQIANNLSLQIFGNEKSADIPNLVDPRTQETVAHQWAKSYEGEKTLHELYSDMFSGVNRVSLTKPVHDVKIFQTLFDLDTELPYLTNSCNVRKPWCCHCEKCAYVFAGFSAFGVHDKVVKAFGKDLFNERSVLPIWEELLGLKGYVPWECVGHPNEVQLYFYKVRNKGVKGCAVEMFEDRVLKRFIEQRELETYFDGLEENYSRVYEEHHFMPNWLWGAVKRDVFELA